MKSVEHSNQLQRYREIVEKEFSDCEKIYIYLTPDNTLPTDDNWLNFGYSTIASINKTYLTIFTIMVFELHSRIDTDVYKVITRLKSTLGFYKLNNYFPCI